MIITEYMENGSLDSFLRVGIQTPLFLFGFSLVLSFLLLSVYCLQNIIFTVFFSWHSITKFQVFLKSFLSIQFMHYYILLLVPKVTVTSRSTTDS